MLGLEEGSSDLTEQWVAQQLLELELIKKQYSNAGHWKKRFYLRRVYQRIVFFEMNFQYQLMEPYLEELAKLEPEVFDWQTKLAVVYLKNGKFNKAEQLLAGLFESREGTEKINSGIVLAALYESLGNLQAAKKIYSSIVSRHPAQYDSCVKLATLKKIKKNFDGAIKQLKTCSKLADKKAKNLYLLEIGRIYYELRLPQKAKEYFEQAYKLDKNNEVVFLTLVSFLEEQGLVDRKEGMLNRFLNDNPDNQSVLSRLIDHYIQTKQEDKVLPHLERLVDLQEGNHQTRFKLALLYRELSQYDDSNHVFNELLSLDTVDKDKIYFYQHLNFKDKNDIGKAIKTLKRVSAEGVLFVDATTYASNLYRVWYSQEKKGDKRSRIEQNFFTFVKERKKINSSLGFELTVSEMLFLEEQKNYKKALEVCLEIVNDKRFSTDHQFYLANLYEKNLDFKSADNMIQGILKENPKSAHAWNFLGYSLLTRPGGDLNKAFEHITKAVELKPKDFHIRDSLGWYYYKVKKYDQAVKELRYAHSGLPDDLTISEHFAMALEMTGEYLAALEIYKKIRSKTKDDEKSKAIGLKIDHLARSKSRLPAEKKP